MKYPNAVRLLKAYIVTTQENIDNNGYLLQKAKDPEYKSELQDKIAERKAKIEAYKEELETLQKL